MKNIKLGNDLTIYWKIDDYDFQLFTENDGRLFIIDSRQNRIQVDWWDEEEKIVTVFYGKDQKYYGTYSLEAICYYGTDEQRVLDKKYAFKLVCDSDLEDGDEVDIDSTLSVSVIGDLNTRLEDVEAMSNINGVNIDDLYDSVNEINTNIDNVYTYVDNTVDRIDDDIVTVNNSISDKVETIYGFTNLPNLIKITSYSDKIKTIKFVREVTGLGLAEAKDLVANGLPIILFEDATKAEENLCYSKLKDNAEAGIILESNDLDLTNYSINNIYGLNPVEIQKKYIYINEINKDIRNLDYAMLFMKIWPDKNLSECLNIYRSPTPIILVEDATDKDWQTWQEAMTSFNKGTLNIQFGTLDSYSLVKATSLIKNQTDLLSSQDYRIEEIYGFPKSAYNKTIYVTGYSVKPMLHQFIMQLLGCTSSEATEIENQDFPIILIEDATDKDWERVKQLKQNVGQYVDVRYGYLNENYYSLKETYNIIEELKAQIEEQQTKLNEMESKLDNLLNADNNEVEQ